MNPLRLRAKGYRTFRDLDIDLPAGCAAILGVNGAGKSSLVNLVDVALFGPEGRSWAPYLTAGGDSIELEVELEFEHAGGLFRVRRGYSARGSGKTQLDLERLLETRTENGHGLTASEAVAQSWEPLTRESQAATQVYLEQLLGMTRETFRASSFLAQGDGAAFSEAKPADRKRILAAVLGLDRFARLQDLVKADRKADETEVAKLTGALERSLDELDQRSAVETMLQVAREDVGAASIEHGKAGACLEAAEAEVQRIEQLRAGRVEATAAVARADAALEPLEQRHRDAEAAARELQITEEEIGTLHTVGQREQVEADVAALEHVLAAYQQACSDREATARDAVAQTAQRDAIAAQATAKTSEAEQLDAQAAAVIANERPRCPTCEQELGADARAATLANLRVRAQVCEDDRKALAEQAAGIEIPTVPPEPEPPVQAQQQLADARARLLKAQTDALRAERLAGQAQILRERVAAAPDSATLAQARDYRARLAAELDELPAVPDDSVARAAAVDAKAVVTAAQARLDEAKALEARAAARKERLDDLDQQTAADRTERERLQRNVDRLLVLERAYGRDGIPALIIQGAAIPSIESEAARILDELGTSYRVELRTARELAGGGMADALDVVVITDRGERPYETFSGGERTRLNLALRIALARLLSTRRGAESRLLAIDEPEFLDEAGTAALARVLQGLNGSFDRTYLISHVPDLRGAFDQTLEVVKGDDGFSRVAA